MASAEITEATVLVFFWKVISAFTVSPLAVAALVVAFTETSDKTLPPSFKTMFTVSSSPALSTTTSLIFFLRILHNLKSVCTFFVHQLQS